jgi:Tol biopolymer transport system component/DNA-binding winged helix-turn-helix (wHTH) protein
LPQQKAYRFGTFRVDVRRRLLRSGADGHVVSLTPKAFDLLLYLVEHPGQPLPKQELLDAVWPTVIVEENNLTRTISTLRRALGETPHDHRFVATEPGYGYRFVARVIPVEEEVRAATDTGPPGHPRSAYEGEHPPVETTPTVRRLPRAGILAAALAVAIGLAGVLLRFPAEQVATDGTGAPGVTDIQLVLNAPGSDTQPTFSPGGSRMAFVNDETGVPQLYVKNLKRGEPRRLTDDPAGIASPSWSPRDDRIVYASRAGGIWTIDPMGTLLPRMIIEDGYNPSFSFDGRTIVYERGAEIRIADADGGNQRSVSGVPFAIRMFANAWPRLSPDGRDIVYFQQYIGPIGDYWIVPTQGGTPRRLTFDRHWGGQAAWLPDGAHVIFPSKRGGALTLWSVPAKGGTPQPLTTGLGDDQHPDVAANGKQLLYTTTRFEAQFIVSDPATGQQQEIFRHRRLVAFPRVSPDGKYITFFGEVEPREQVLVMNADGSNVRQLTEYRKDEANIMPRWSADGRSVYYYQNLPPNSFRRIALGGGPSEAVFPGFGWETHTDVEWDSGGNRIAYIQTNPETLERRAIVRNVRTGTETALARDLQFAPSWSEDGKLLLGTDVGQVVLCPVDGSECAQVIDTRPPPGAAHAVRQQNYYARWSWDHSRIFHTRSTEDPLMLELWVVDRDGSDAHFLFDIGPVHPLAARFQVLPGDRILWVRYRRDQSEVVLATLSRSDG